MSILYILNSGSMDGASISFLNLLKGMRDKGFECHVVIPRKSLINPIFIKELELLKVRFYIIPVYFSIRNVKTVGSRNVKYLINSFFVIKKIKKVESYIRLYRLIKKIRPDIVHTNVGIIHQPFMICEKLGIRHIWHLREYQDLDFKWEILPTFEIFCEMLKRTEVITITDDIRRHFHLESYSNVYTIYNGVLDIKDAKLIFPKEKYFLCASRISKEKGHYDVINAFAAFYREHPDYKLLIAGYGNDVYLNELKSLAKKLKCSNAVLFLGYCKNVYLLMHKAKALIVASYYEGFGRMTAEALFCGCLVIGRNTGGTKEILDYTGGLMFQGCFDNLQQKMNEVVSMSEDKYCSLVSKCQNRAITKYSNEMYIENIYKLYCKKQ